MANQSYTAFRSQLLIGNFDLESIGLKVAAVRGYTFNSEHSTMADAAAAGAVINGTPAALTNPTVVDGAFDSDDCAITTTANAAAHTLIVYQASAVLGGADLAAGSQTLFWYFDTGTGLPLIPGTGILTIIWPATAAKIYKVGA